jgi:hypothetical protein
VVKITLQTWASEMDPTLRKDRWCDVRRKNKTKTRGWSKVVIEKKIYVKKCKISLFDSVCVCVCVCVLKNT